MQEGSRVVRARVGAWGIAGALVALCFPGLLSAAEPTDYAVLLAKSVNEHGIDYGELAAGRAALDRYVLWLGTADPGATDADRIAFWINAHNALTLRQALDARPVSVRDVPAFSDRAWRVAGRDVTLHGIEEILAAAGDPLVLFALYRAARSSPPLAAVLYEGRDLRATLEQQARAYLADAGQNRFEYAQQRAELSMLLLWHHEELEAGRKGDVPPLQLFLADHLPADRTFEPIARSLRKQRWDISFRPFDWALDDVPAPRRAHPAWLLLYGIAALALLSLGFRTFRRLLSPPAPRAPAPPDG